MRIYKNEVFYTKSKRYDFYVNDGCAHVMLECVKQSGTLHQVDIDDFEQFKSLLCAVIEIAKKEKLCVLYYKDILRRDYMLRFGFSPTDENVLELQLSAYSELYEI